MGTRDAIKLLRQYGVFPRRKRRWQPTEQWRAAMLENLSRDPRRRSPEETWQIKQAVRDWLALPEAQRPTQQALADTWGVSKQRINRLVHQLPPSAPLSEHAPARTPESTGDSRPQSQPPSTAQPNDTPPHRSAGIPTYRIWTPERERVDDLLRMWAGITGSNRGNSWFPNGF